MGMFQELISKIPKTLYTRDMDSDLGKLFTIYAEKFEGLDLIIDSLETIRNIKNAEGPILDKIGSIIREPRRNRNDDDYRAFLYVAIRRNISNGDLPTISQITNQLIAGYENVSFEITELHSIAGDSFLDGNIDLLGNRLLNPSTPEPAAFEIALSGETGQIDQELFEEIVGEIRSAGVDAEIRITT